MFDYGKVGMAIDMIVRETDPRVIIVFGSVARREARDDSDLDLLVVFDRVENRTECYARIARQFLGLDIPFDIMVMDYDEFLRYKENELSFTHEIVTTGEVAYVRGIDSEASSGHDVAEQRPRMASVRWME